MPLRVNGWTSIRDGFRRKRSRRFGAVGQTRTKIELVGISVVQGVMLRYMILDSSAKGVQDGFKTVDFVFEVMHIGNAETWFLPFLIETYSVVSSTPST